jgi:ATP-dependent Clp protease protease subunit
MQYDADENEKEKGPEKEEKEDSKLRSKIEEAMLKSRTIMIYGEINQEVAEKVCSKLIMYSALGDEEIKVFINSPGGHVESGDSIFDVIRFVKPLVKVIGTGWVASAGALIYSAPPVEQRYCLPNTRFMLHQPMGGVRGQASDISIEAQEILKMRDRLNRSFAKQTGQPLDRVEKDTERNFWMGPEEAKAYGLVGKIVHSASEI